MNTDKVLVVDDSTLIRRILRDGLEEAGFQVTELADGTTLLGALERERPALLLLDIMMPGVDGLSLCREIRANARYRDLKIAIVSSKKYAADRALALKLGADTFISKPFEIQDVVRIARQLLAGQILIKFWGTRGSIPTPGPDYAKYGGNTPCVEFRFPPRETLFIFDAGTGIRELGRALMAEGKPRRGYIFLTHAHWDHIQGLPFFMPAYQPEYQFTLLGPNQPELPFKDILHGQMENAYFPVPFGSLSAIAEVRALQEQAYEFDGIGIEAMLTNHPGNTFMYRITYGGRRIVHATDSEIEPWGAGPLDSMAGLREKIVDFFTDLDLLIHDAQYTDEEYEVKRGWGHSTWREVVHMAHGARVKKLLLFHHDPDHTDGFIDRILDEAKQELARLGSTTECEAVRERLEITL